jgi:hypothetical protein
VKGLARSCAGDGVGPPLPRLTGGIDVATPDPPGHDQFLTACARHQIDAARAEELWRDLFAAAAAPAGRARELSRPAIATVIAGSLLLSGAGLWWVGLISGHAGTGGVLAFAVCWVAVFAALAEYTHRSRVAYVDAAFAVVAVAYVPLAIGAAEDLVLGQIFNHWWGRLPIELGLLLAAAAAARRFLRPLLTMLPVAIAGGALAADGLVSSFDGWDTDITGWPGWSAFLALGIAAVATTVAVRLDRRGRRETAFWPALLADSWTLGAMVGIAVAVRAGTAGAGIAVATAGSVVFARGVAVGRLVQITVGAVAFWVGVIMLGSRWGDLAVAGLTSLAGISLIAGAVYITRRPRLLDLRRHPGERGDLDAGSAAGIRS